MAGQNGWGQNGWGQNGWGQNGWDQTGATECPKTASCRDVDAHRHFEVAATTRNL